MPIKMRITIEGMFKRKGGKVSFLANYPAKVIRLEEVNPKEEVSPRQEVNPNNQC